MASIIKTKLWIVIVVIIVIIVVDVVIVIVVIIVTIVIIVIIVISYWIPDANFVSKECETCICLLELFTCSF